MATAPEGVVEEKTLTWRRTSGSGGSCGSFLQVTAGGIFQIMPSDLDQPVSTSVLTVTETVAAMWRYCCQATLLGASGTSNEILITVTGKLKLLKDIFWNCVIPFQIEELLPVCRYIAMHYFLQINGFKSLWVAILNK